MRQSATPHQFCQLSRRRSRSVSVRCPAGPCLRFGLIKPMAIKTARFCLGIARRLLAFGARAAMPLAVRIRLLAPGCPLTLLARLA